MLASTTAGPVLAPTRARAIALVGALFIFLFAAYAFTASADLFSTGDTTIRVEIAENLLYRHTMELTGWKLDYPHHLKKEFLDPRVDVGRGGFTNSTYLLGQPLAIIPFDLLGSNASVHERWPYGPSVMWFAHLVGPLFGALEVTVFFIFAVRLGFGLRRSLLLTLIFAFASSVWPDEQSVLEHTEVAFFLLLGTYLAFRFREQGKADRYLLFTGMAVGGAMITRYQDAALGVVALTIYLLLRSERAPRLQDRFRWVALAGLGLLPFVIIDTWTNWVKFDNPLATGHHETVFGYPPWKGALGLIVSPGKGIIWYTPLIFLLILAGPRFARRFPTLSIGMAAMVLGFLALYSNVTYWHGDPAWGPRYIYPILPYLILPLGMLFQRRWRRAPLVWGITALLVAASFTIQVAAVSVSPWRTWYRVIAYEENQGYNWDWIAARYRYFWNPHESPLYFQLHGLYQMAYDSLLNSNKYSLVPPDEDPTLDGLTTDFAVNQWNVWWAANEFNWWMGERKIILGATMLVAVMLASGTYLTAEAAGLFSEPSQRTTEEPVPEAA